MNLNSSRKRSSPAQVLETAVDPVVCAVTTAANSTPRLHPLGLPGPGLDAVGISTQDLLQQLLGAAADAVPFLTPDAAKRRAADEDEDEEDEDEAEDDDEEEEEEADEEEDLEEEEDEDLDDEDDEDEDDDDEDEDEDEFDDPDDDDDDFDDDDDDDFDDEDE
jgi:hypothetical protein